MPELDDDYPDFDEDGLADCVDDDDDNDGSADLDDCVPNNPDIHPAAPEICDGIDNNCADGVDEDFEDIDNDNIADCVDDDKDGDGTPNGDDNCPAIPNDQANQDGDTFGDACDTDIDGDNVVNGDDCAPTDFTIHPGALELCDGVDQDCDSDTDEGFGDIDKDLLADCVDPDDDGDGKNDDVDNCQTIPNPDQADQDKDGIGDACENDLDGDGDPDQFDCAPNNKDIYHNATEVCDGDDENCNGFIDEGFPDSDGDGLANCVDTDDDNDGKDDTADNCPLVKNANQLNTDGDEFGNACDDDDDDDGTIDELDCAPLDKTVHPNAVESCNGKNDNCKDGTDEEDAAGCKIYYYNNDGDAYGVEFASKCLCEQSGKYTATESGDCNDSDLTIFPNATEFCNNKDDNCDKVIDEINATGCQLQYADNDFDGYGDPEAAKVCVCPGAVGFALVPGDCDDEDFFVNSGVNEVCGDDIDNDCNNTQDEPDAEGCTKYYLDYDKDDWGVPDDKACLCTPEGKYTATQSGDCNDFNDLIHPGAEELCNTIDDDCDGPKDEDVVTQTIYKDNDGDGVAAENAQTQESCDVPPGWTVAKDVNDDGTLDWDCDDSDVTRYPGGPSICGDGKDNDCDGYIDRLCFGDCVGAWPYQQAFVKAGDVYHADLDGDGQHEITFNSSHGFAILTNEAAPLFDYSQAGENASRRPPVFADMDQTDTFHQEIQTLEVLTGLKSTARLYRYNVGNAAEPITEIANEDVAVYDASGFMVQDINKDGKPEFVTSTWCQAVGTRIFNFNPETETLDQVAAIDDPDGACVYTNERLLTDLNGDGEFDMVHGNGYAQGVSPSKWSGKVHAWTFPDPLDLEAITPICDPATCFDTTIAGAYSGSANFIIRVGDEIRVFSRYFETNISGGANKKFSRYWRFDLNGDPIDNNQPGADSSLGYYLDITDIDDDGEPEADTYVKEIGLFDLDGTGPPERIYHSGNELRMSFWNTETKKWVEHVPARKTLGTGTIRQIRIWDINDDGQAEVLVTDTDGKLFCQRLGVDTWNKHTSLPPHHRRFYNTFQWDNFEPNEGGPLDENGLPTQTMQVPSALTAKGDFYSYLTSPNDKDYFVVNTKYSAQICLHPPPNRHYTLEIYSYKDRWNNATEDPGGDGIVDGLIWKKKSGPGAKLCYGAYDLVPPRTGEYKYIIGIVSEDGDHSLHWPYWLTITK